MGYSKLPGSRVESRFPCFAVAAVSIVITIQLLVIWSNSSPIYGITSVHEAKQFGIETSAKKEMTRFPRKIWQTSKTGPGGFDDGDRDAIRTWTKLNQKWRFESLTQYGAESYVQERYADEPEIQEIFTDLQDPILRADMIRYLVLLRDGGLYTDIDTKSLKPIDDWVPVEYQGNTSIVVGVEYDRLNGNRWNDWTLDLQFSTWAILAKPDHRLLRYAVRRVTDGLKTLALRQGKTISGVKASREEVLDTTGPALFTRSIFEILSESTGTSFTWRNVTNLKKPRLIDDILILPITAFGCGQGHSDSGHPNEETALVQHFFKGSWKGEHMLEEDARKEELQAKQDHEEARNHEDQPKEDEHHEDSSPSPQEEAAPQADKEPASEAQTQEHLTSPSVEGNKDLREDPDRDPDRDPERDKEKDRNRVVAQRRKNGRIMGNVGRRHKVASNER
ncbi:hypothetical protein MMC10_001266 [Thelotrema lepadinum]|nr:hypothetical protein [Thelotrema lepadinum]